MNIQELADRDQAAWEEATQQLYADIDNLRSRLSEATGLLTDLWQYDNLSRPVEGVLYANGTHAEVRARVTDFLGRQAELKSN